MTSIVFVFSSSTTANYLVAGVPAAARVVYEAELAQSAGSTFEKIVIAVEGGWSPSSFCQAEIKRLGPSLKIITTNIRTLDLSSDMTVFEGEALHSSQQIIAQTTTLQKEEMAAKLPPQTATTEQLLSEMKLRGRAILLATGKPSDGIVSRYINRPISRAISRLILPIPGILPFHATIAAAAIGAVMAACLFFGGSTGLLVGAALFQLASIIDGVDGEIARATHRSSLAGAKLDSLTDAATNLAFIAGVSANLYLRDLHDAAAAGLATLIFLTIGTLLLGRRAKAKGGKFTFDEVKNHVRERPSRLMQILTWITMRDFYAAAAALAILAGFVQESLMVSAVISGCWLIFTLWVLGKTAQSK